MIPFSKLPALIHGQLIQLTNDEEIHYLITDSRKVLATPKSLFFSIKGTRHDGHDYLSSAYKQGIRQFVIEKSIDPKNFPLANFVKVDSAIKALQNLVTHHRKQFTYPVIGVTGSNGKTIVKEWLYQMLTADFKCIKNPGSYNSQIGVPLSVWEMSNQHELGIFEAGISKPGEMGNLREVMRPDIGLFTNLGSAHDEGFESTQEKLNEKLKLFITAKTIIFCGDDPQVREGISKHPNLPSDQIIWGQHPDSNVLLQFKNDQNVHISGRFNEMNFRLPFADSASSENALHCIMVLLHLGYPESSIQEKIDALHTIAMRLELKQGINHCQIVDDTYNNDLGGLRIGLDFLEGLNQPKKTLILSDILQSSSTLEEISIQVAQLIKEKEILKFIGIGFGLHSQQEAFASLPITKKFYLTTEDFITSNDFSDFINEAILIKGARVFQFERIVQLLQKKIHGTIMEINMEALVHNLNFFKSLLNPDVKLMVMVKAFAYGSGSTEIASLLQYHRIDYLGVAYVDEGVELRKNRIHLPIMVMNPSEEGFPLLLEHELEPEIYSLSLLRALVLFLNGRSMRIHLKIDTGMHRLGYEWKDLEDAVEMLSQNPNVKITSIFSHLAGADESIHDEFSKYQAEQFNRAVRFITDKLCITPIRHILNSSGILRMKDYQFDMVRLGIGLYGIDPTGDFDDKLKPVAVLKTVISQIKKVEKGETIGYGRRGIASNPITIATLAIGYADGFSRVFGNGVGNVLIKNKRAPVIGNVCMDMTMVDISHISGVSEGDEAIIFGGELPIQELATKANTIPYEILTSTSERVKRIFYAESI